MTAAIATPNTRSPAPTHRSTSYGHEKATILLRLRRVEGQVRGVQRMVAEDAHCTEVLAQLSAVIAAARQTGVLVTESYLGNCIQRADCLGSSDREEALTDLIGVIEHFVRTVR